MLSAKRHDLAIGRMIARFHAKKNLRLCGLQIAHQFGLFRSRPDDEQPSNASLTLARYSESS
jgi:hypothetical protein